MSGIQTGIELQDSFSGVLQGIIGSVNVTVGALENMQQTMNADIDTSGIDVAREAINQTTAAVDALNAAVESQTALDIAPVTVPGDTSGQVINVDVNPVLPDPLVENPDPVPLEVKPNAPPDLFMDDIEASISPVITQQPQIDVPEGISVPVNAVVEQQPVVEVPDGLNVPVTAEVTQQPQIDVPEGISVPVDVSTPDISSTEQQIAELTNRLNGVAEMQTAISNVGKNLYVLPDDTARAIASINREILRTEQAINFLRTNPFNFDSSVAELQIKAISDGLDDVVAKQKNLDELMDNIPSQIVNVEINTETPAPVKIPVHWETDRLEAFTSTGVDRFRQEVQSANSMLEQLNSTQDAIARQAYSTNLFPPESFQDLNSLAVRVDNMRERIQQIENNPVNLGTDTANAEMEQLRAQLNRMVQEQNELNEAIQNMDVSAANDAYLRLSQTVSGTERYIRDNVDEQGRFNQEISQGTQQADGLMNAIKGAVAAYVSIQSIGKVLGISDELTQTTSRLDMMNDGAQSTQELVNMVYAAAQDARGSFAEMADVVARFGNNAQDAFSSSEEVVAFADLIQKQMTIAGASTQEASNAMLQLSQALGSGVLRGDELNSIFEQSPNLIQSIADYLDVPIGQIREMASEGELSADIVKAAIFASADEINAKFEQMPMTWGQIWQSMQNTALIAFQPVLQRLNDVANSQAFQTFVDGAIEAMATLANILLNIFDLVATVGSFIADNWSIISPIIYGVIGALAVYAVYQGITATATAIVTAAQWAWNAAMSASPLTWIIMLIIALIAIIFAVCNAIAKLTGIANSGFGVITGGVNVVIQFFKNLGLTVTNIALGICNAIAALASNMMTAFHNAICSVQSWFYNLLSTALTVIEGICAALNKLPFVEFDYSGISSAADDYAAKAAEAAGNKEDYKSIGDAFNDGFNTFDTFQDGWASDAFNAGASWGDGVADAVSDFSLSDIFGSTDIPNVDEYTSGFGDAIASSGMGNSLGDIAGDTGSIKDAMDITEEDLKYLRDIAEQETINRFTTAEIKVKMTNHNNISNDMDLDGVVSGLADGVNEAIETMAEGVHD